MIFLTVHCHVLFKIFVMSDSVGTSNKYMSYLNITNCYKILRHEANV
jgi:hypothetical protein